MNENARAASVNDPTTAAVFPVELRDVYVPMPKEVKKQGKFHAVVDVQQSHVFAVVGNDYKLITNEEAKGLCKDVTDIGRWGNGDVEVGLSSLDELPYVLGLVRQSLELQLGNGGES